MKKVKLFTNQEVIHHYSKMPGRLLIDLDPSLDQSPENVFQMMRDIADLLNRKDKLSNKDKRSLRLPKVVRELAYGWNDGVWSNFMSHSLCPEFKQGAYPIELARDWSSERWEVKVAFPGNLSLPAGSEFNQMPVIVVASSLGWGIGE